jgi:glutathione reductase (NADPH)
MTFDYDLFVIGAGPSGLTAAKRAAQYGAKVAISDYSYPGGTCANRGCVPKKLMVYAADFAKLIPDAVGYGWSKANTSFDWQALVEAVAQEIEKIRQSQFESLADAGIKFYGDRASFVDAHTLTVGGQKVTADTVLIAVGGKPFKPPIPGIEYAVTSDDMFHLKQLPQRIGIIGGGYIGVEFASILCSFGVQVTLMNHEDCILEGFDQDVQERVRQSLTNRGIQIFCNTTAQEIQPGSEDLCLVLEGDCPEKLTVDLVLCATGRAPNLEDLGLDKAGVEVDKKAIVVNERNCTSQPNIFAVGDCTNQQQLTPVARADGLVFAEQVFGKNSQPKDYTYIPSAVCTRPEVATVGLTEAQAREKLGDAVQGFSTEFLPLFHKLSQRQEKSFFKLVVDRQCDRVLGIHMVGEHAAEILQGFVPALEMGLTKQQLDRTIGIHPSSGEEMFSMR